MKSRSPLVLTVIWAALLAGAQAEKICGWNVGEGSMGEASSWMPEIAPEISSTLRWEIRNGGTATISAGQTVGIGLDLLIASGRGSGTVVLSGDGSLTVKRFLSIGQAGTGTGEVILNDKSTLYIENGSLLVGQRSNGTLKIGREASVVVQAGNTKVGEGMNGVIHVEGAFETPDMIFGLKNGGAQQNGMLDLAAGGTFRASKKISFNDAGLHFVQITGSGGDFTCGSLTTTSAATFRFVADASGITPIKVVGTCDVTGAALEVNLDAFKGGQKIALVEGASITGEFASVKWLGRTQGTIKYEKSGIFITGAK